MWQSIVANINGWFGLKVNRIWFWRIWRAFCVRQIVKKSGSAHRNSNGRQRALGVSFSDGVIGFNAGREEGGPILIQLLFFDRCVDGVNGFRPVKRIDVSGYALGWNSVNDDICSSSRETIVSTLGSYLSKLRMSLRKRTDWNNKARLQKDTAGRSQV